eukprot:TRINITY_DN1569_c1_g1_i3.p1 TRINITY_DN1569_c1_g1~~TRINITY_DN1569_c1_g1_i3.p1  ORF type:complete len:1617 (+),score=333.34 TRINITY_DN1569_c1_g1_i3:95-4852(+)
MKTILALVLLGLSASTSASASGQGSTIDTMITSSCDGTFTLFPDNEFLNVKVDVSFLPRVYGSGIASVGTYLKEYCGAAYNSGVLKSRFDLGTALLTGNRWFNDIGKEYDACVDKVETFSRDLTKLYEMTFDDAHDMPPTCNYDNWVKQGSCAFEFAVGGFTDITLQVRVERCANYKGFPRVHVGCSGTGCKIFTPCTADSDCPSPLLCRDAHDAFGLTDFLNSLGYSTRENRANDDANAKKLVSSLIAAFGSYFNGATTGSSVCLPKKALLEDGISGYLKSVWGSGARIMNGFSGCSSGSFWDPPMKRFLTMGIMGPWDGLVGGKSPFEASTGATFPPAQYPSGEHHAVSIQCDGLIHLFAGTGHSVRIHKPHLSKMVQIWAECNMEAYPYPNVDEYLKNMAVWRPEPFLSLSASSTGNAKSLVDNGLSLFTFSSNEPGMSSLSYDQWKASKSIAVSIGAKNDVLGADFRANFRMDQCPEAMGLVATHVSCVGEICKSLLLQNTCLQSSECPTGSKCDPLDSYYDNDFAAQVLWGSDGVGNGGWATGGCPADEPIGENYRKLTTQEPATSALSNGLNALRFANCEGRDDSKCVSSCKKENGKCVPSNGTPTPLATGSGLCLIDSSISEEDFVTVGPTSPYAVSFPVISELGSTTYSSEETVVNPLPEPTNPVPESPKAINAYETIAMATCGGRYRIFPDNEMFSFTIDAPIVSAALRKYMPIIERYVTGHCPSKAKPTTSTFMERFHPFSLLLNSGEPEHDACLDDLDTFVRDFIKRNPTEKYLFPETCTMKTWKEEGTCVGKVRFPNFPDVAFNIDIRRCESGNGLVDAAVGCEGGGCNAFFTPCSTDSDCGGHSQCLNPIDEADPLKAYEFMRDTMYMFDPTSQPSDKVKVLFQSFLDKFKSYFKGSSADAQKVCFPLVYTKDREELSSTTVIREEREWTNYCGFTGDSWMTWWYAQMYSTTLLQTSLTSDRIDKFETIPQEIKDKASRRTDIQYFQLSYGRGLGNGITYTDDGKTYKIGGGACQTHDDCNSADGPLNFCFSSWEMCELSESCNNGVNSYSKTDRQCACSLGANFETILDSPSSTFWDSKLTAKRLALGEKCQDFSKFYEGDSTVTVSYPNTPLFYPWDGKLSNGGRHFDKVATWEAFPSSSIPVGEMSFMSVQCNGVISFMEGTPLAVRVHAPQFQDLLQFVGEQYVAEMKGWISSSAESTEDAFRRAQAPWRPEMWIWNLVAGSPSDVSSFTGISSHIFGDSPKKLSLGDFIYTTFVSNREGGTGFSYSGLRYLMGNDFKANVRFQNCPSHPLALVSMDIGCQGEVCKALAFQRPCSTGNDCTVGSCVSAVLFDKDFIAENLWGMEDDLPVKSGQNWAEATTCPAQRGSGSVGVDSTSLNMLYESAASVYEVVFQSACAGKPECACVGGCKWSSGNCVETAAPLDAKWQSQEIKLCLPKLFPFPSAFIEDLGYPTGEVGQPNSADIYTVTKGQNTVYGVDKDIMLLTGAPERTQIVVVDSDCGLSPSSENEDSSGLGGGALVAIIVGGALVLLAAVGAAIYCKGGKKTTHFDGLHENEEPLKDVELGGRL